MGERRRRSASNESKMVNAVPRLERGSKTIEGHPMSETPGAEALGESGALQDPSAGGLGQSVDTGRSALAACWRPSKGRFGP
jgi:hypothetical protein